MRMTLSVTVILCMWVLLVDFRYPPVACYDLRQEESLRDQEEKRQLSSRYEKLKDKVESTEKSLQVELNLQFTSLDRALVSVPSFHFGFYS